MNHKMKRGSRNVVYEAPRGRRNAPYTTARGVTHGSENSAHDAVDVFKRFLTSWRTLSSQEGLSLTCLRHEQRVLGPFSTFPDERLNKHQKLPVRVRLQLFALSLWLWSVFNTATPGSIVARLLRPESGRHRGFDHGLFLRLCRRALFRRLDLQVLVF